MLWPVYKICFPQLSLTCCMPDAQSVNEDVQQRRDIQRLLDSLSLRLNLILVCIGWFGCQNGWYAGSIQRQNFKDEYNL